jgi:malate/lactate dehydrogenase
MAQSYTLVTLTSYIDNIYESMLISSCIIIVEKEEVQNRLLKILKNKNYPHNTRLKVLTHNQVTDNVECLQDYNIVIISKDVIQHTGIDYFDELSKNGKIAIIC